MRVVGQQIAVFAHDCLNQDTEIAAEIEDAWHATPKDDVIYALRATGIVEITLVQLKQLFRPLDFFQQYWCEARPWRWLHPRKEGAKFAIKLQFDLFVRV